MARVVVSTMADADTSEILVHLTTEAGVRTAERYGALIDAFYDRVSTYPDSGAPRPRLGRGIRIGLVPPYVILYEHLPDQDEVLIHRIVHGARKVTRKLLNAPPADRP
jgi:plasmid stabilization system protein ParE